jgi:hypothetical protein
MHHISLINVRIVCPKAAASTMGIIWVPERMIKHEGRSVSPVFCATGCTIEGFQVGMRVEMAHGGQYDNMQNIIHGINQRFPQDILHCSFMPGIKGDCPMCQVMHNENIA